MKEILFPKNYIWLLAVKKGIVWILAWISTGFKTGKKQQVAMETRSYDAGVCFTAEFRSGLDRAETSFFSLPLTCSFPDGARKVCHVFFIAFVLNGCHGIGFRVSTYGTPPVFSALILDGYIVSRKEKHRTLPPPRNKWILFSLLTGVKVH